MIKLSKIKGDPKETEHLCKCRPICKSRRREWNGNIQNTSAELLLERKSPAECYRRWPMKVYPNGPCPLFGRTKRVTINKRNKERVTHTIRICQAPVEDTVDTPYLRYTEMAKQLEAINPIYKDLSNVKLLKKCIGGFTQNNNESYNQLLRKITPKIIIVPCGSKVVEIAAYIAARMFNEGAWNAVRACCAFCDCGECCPCGVRDYVPYDEEQSSKSRNDMRSFDARVKNDYKTMRIMYDKS